MSYRAPQRARTERISGVVAKREGNRLQNGQCVSSILTHASGCPGGREDTSVYQDLVAVIRRAQHHQGSARTVSLPA